MKNYTTRYFCRKYSACREGAKFALKYKTMRECFAALLAGEGGEKSAEWAIWAFTRPGIASDSDLQMFAIKCVRRVKYLMKDSRSLEALNVVKKYSNGEVNKEELEASCAYAWGPYAIAYSLAEAASYISSYAASYADAWSTERSAQMQIIAEFGNPFDK